MYGYRWIAFISMILTSLFICACGSDVKEESTAITAEKLDGRWELFSAMRNGESTMSLEGTYIEFEDGHMTTNFTGETVKTAINLSDKKLTQNEQVFDITSLSNDTLALTTALMNYKFRLHFAKSALDKVSETDGDGH